MDKRLEAFKKLLDIMDELRTKCPWDKKQTFESLRHLTIEETYELADAIILKDSNEIRNELGDLLLHIVFYAKIGSENNDFDITEVIEGINKKLIQRHPHIFSDVIADTVEEVKHNWEKELAYLVIHGILHLLGHSDYTPGPKKKMFKAQDKVFKCLFL